eukprot:scaffold17685_cov63-Phaeocystis_antarctica.AAC.14
MPVCYPPPRPGPRIHSLPKRTDASVAPDDCLICCTATCGATKIVLKRAGIHLSVEPSSEVNRRSSSPEVRPGAALAILRRSAWRHACCWRKTGVRGGVRLRLSALHAVHVVVVHFAIGRAGVGGGGGSGARNDSVSRGVVRNHAAARSARRPRRTRPRWPLPRVCRRRCVRGLSPRRPRLDLARPRQCRRDGSARARGRAAAVALPGARAREGAVVACRTEDLPRPRAQRLGELGQLRRRQPVGREGLEVGLECAARGRRRFCVAACHAALSRGGAPASAGPMPSSNDRPCPSSAASLSSRACLRLPQAPASLGQSAALAGHIGRGFDVDAGLHVLRPIASRVPRALEAATDDEHTREEPHQVRHGTRLRTRASSWVLLAPRALDRWRRTGRALAASEAGQVGAGRIPAVPVVRRVPAPLVLAHTALSSDKAKVTTVTAARSLGG